jgi:hypothetical protein
MYTTYTERTAKRTARKVTTRNAVTSILEFAIQFVSVVAAWAIFFTVCIMTETLVFTGAPLVVFLVSVAWFALLALYFYLVND